MATYVVSDIHGAYYTFLSLLNRVRFNPTEDKLYVLGDIIDRNIHSAEMLEWAYDAPSSVKFLIGNHEDMMLATMREYNELEKRDYFEDEGLLFNFIYNSIWIGWNGGANTFEYLMDLPRARREDLLNWIQSWPLFYDITVQSRRFVLVHAGLAMNGIRISDDRYSKGINVDVEIEGFPVQNSQSLLWIRENWFFDQSELPCDVVFGHTSTPYLFDYLEDFNEWAEIDKNTGIPIEKGKEILHFGEGLRKHCIDTGRSVMSILRLDDMMEFVLDVEE